MWGDIHREKKRTRYRPIRDHRAGGTASAALTFVRCPRRFRHGAVAPERALGVRKGFLQFHVVVFLLKPHGSSACVLADGSFFCFFVLPGDKAASRDAEHLHSSFQAPRRVDGEKDAGRMRSAGRDVKTWETPTTMMLKIKQQAQLLWSFYPQAIHMCFCLVKFIINKYIS